MEIRSGYTELKNISGTEKITSNDFCGYFHGPGKNGQIYTIDCEVPIPSKFLTLQIVANVTTTNETQKHVLQLNEVKINELII